MELHPPSLESQFIVTSLTGHRGQTRQEVELFGMFYM
jgi:hypothetical protein